MAVARSAAEAETNVSGVSSKAMIGEVKGVERTCVTGPNGEKDLANVHASDTAVRFAPRSTHPGLQPIGAGAGQHLVDADDVVRVSANAEVETFFAGDFDEVSIGTEAHQSLIPRWGTQRRVRNVLVGTDTGGFQRFGGQLFVLVRDHVHA